MLGDGSDAIDKFEVDAMNKLKEKVYGRILEYLRVEDYPTEANKYFKEANINDLVYAMISPIIYESICITGCKNIKSLGEKTIVSIDGETGGHEEFVVTDFISVKEEKFILIVEAKGSSLEQAMKQCLLAMKDLRENNEDGTIYGFVTTGQSWQMLRYDGKSFKMTREYLVVFHGMGEDKETWMKDCSILVDCALFALNNGGI